MFQFFALLSISAPLYVSPELTQVLSVEDPPQTQLLSQANLLSQPKNRLQKPPQKRPSPPIEFLVPQAVRALPGELDDVPVFNSNSPEVIRESGILLSTFPTDEKAFPDAHLDYELKGRFDIFAHHIARSDFPENTPTMYLGILVQNASTKKRNVIDILQAASFLGTPDAPYISLPQKMPNDLGAVFSGPGGRVSDVILRGRRQANWPPRLYLDPGQSVMIMNLPMPLPTLKNKSARMSLSQRRIIRGKDGQIKRPKRSTPSSNARSTLLHLKSKGKVYVASMAMFAPLNSQGRELIPTKEDWQKLLQSGNLIRPRDTRPSELNSVAEKFFYGRVAGVSRGSEWTAQLTDNPRRKKLTIPDAGDAVSFGIGTLQRGTFATGQIQSAPMLVRYPDTAYLAHGNYGVRYQLTLPLHNATKETREVHVKLQTPIKKDSPSKGLSFYRNPPQSVFFRGTVRVRYNDDAGTPLVKYFHLVHRRGEPGEPLMILNMAPKTSRLVTVDFVYPPDATPPQVLTVQTVR